MTPERWQQIETIFEAADAAPAEERPALLERLCNGDDDLRREIEQLLANREGASIEHLIGAVAVNLTGPALELTGQTLGQYRLIRLIGSGGMGEVFVAEDLRLGRHAAIKVLTPVDSRDADRVRRFQQEARAASALNHPNIVTVFDFGETGGRHYLATELVQGRTLRSMIADGKQPVLTAVDIAIQVASALVAAHEAGIVHRDIKPENIMLRPDGYVKVLDFGLAKLRERDAGADTLLSTLTATGTVMGTTAYMSPEQVRGEPVDARADLFSLGVVLYEMLSGERPFQGRTGADLIAALLEHDPKLLSAHAQSDVLTTILGKKSQVISQASLAFGQVEQVVNKCLRKDRDRRYQSAQDVLADLRQIQADLKTPPAQPAYTRRFRWRPLAAALSLAAILTGGYFWTRPRAVTAFQNSRFTRLPGSSAFSVGVLSADARYIAYVSTLPNGVRSLNLRLLAAPKAIELIPPDQAAYRELAFSADGSFLYYLSHPSRPNEVDALYRIPILGGRPQKLADDVSGRVAVSPDGASLAFTKRKRGEGTLSIMTAEGAGEHELLNRRADYSFQAIEWSADGRKIYFVEALQTGGQADSRIFELGREGGTPRLVAQPGKTFIYDLVPLADGRGFLANAFDQDAGLQQIYHLSRDGTLRHITHDLSEYHGLSVSRDSKQILTSQQERHSELWEVDFADAASAHRVSESGRRYDTPTWARDGSVISTRFEAGSWMLWTIPRGGTERPLMSQPGSDLWPNACPDRDDIVFSSARKGAYSLWRVLPDGSGLKQVTQGPNDRYAQCVAGGTVLYWQQAGNQRTGMQAPLDGGPSAASGALTANQLVSPDGKLVLSPYTDARTHEHRLALHTRDLATTLGSFAFGGRAAATAWAPDSRGFADARGAGVAQEIWYQAIAGGPPRQLTHFGEDEIFDVSWSPDGRQLVCARGKFVSDLVLIQDAK